MKKLYNNTLNLYLFNSSTFPIYHIFGAVSIFFRSDKVLAFLFIFVYNSANSHIINNLSILKIMYSSYDAYLKDLWSEEQTSCVGYRAVYYLDGVFYLMPFRIKSLDDRGLLFGVEIDGTIFVSDYKPSVWVTRFFEFLKELQEGICDQFNLKRICANRLELPRIEEILKLLPLIYHDENKSLYFPHHADWWWYKFTPHGIDPISENLWLSIALIMYPDEEIIEVEPPQADPRERYFVPLRGAFTYEDVDSDSSCGELMLVYRPFSCDVFFEGKYDINGEPTPATLEAYDKLRKFYSAK